MTSITNPAVLCGEAKAAVYDAAPPTELDDWRLHDIADRFLAVADAQAWSIACELALMVASEAERAAAEREYIRDFEEQEEKKYPLA